MLISRVNDIKENYKKVFKVHLTNFMTVITNQTFNINIFFLLLLDLASGALFLPPSIKTDFFFTLVVHSNTGVRWMMQCCKPRKDIMLDLINSCK